MNQQKSIRKINQDTGKGKDDLIILLRAIAARNRKFRYNHCHTPDKDKVILTKQLEDGVYKKMSWMLRSYIKD